MTQTTENTTINVPAPDNFNTEALQGSMQQILSENIGKYVTCEFLVGTQLLQSKTGAIYDVGIGYLALRDAQTRNIILCDVFSVKFVTFYPPDYQPGSETGMGGTANDAAGNTTTGPIVTPVEPNVTSSAQQTAMTRRAATEPRPASAQAAFNYAKRKTRR